MHDLAIVTVSYNSMDWLRALLPTIETRMGDISADVVVVDNGTDGEASELIPVEFPWVRTIRSANHGFGHANNRGLMTCNARYVLFINPDVELLEGTLAELVAIMDSNPRYGLVGCRQVVPGGELDLTIRHFPSALRAFGEAIGAEQLMRKRPSWLGERETDLRSYSNRTACDWTSGSFMLVRREALESAGNFDERFFMYSEETDLCRRIKAAGWEIWHLPEMTILHHDRKAGIQPQMESLVAATRMLYARKHFTPIHRWTYGSMVTLRHLLRSVYAGRDELACQRRAASRAVVATVLGRREIPFAPITSPVAMQSGEAELRRRSISECGGDA